MRPSPAPARSNGADGFPVRRSPAGFVSRVMRPIAGRAFRRDPSTAPGSPRTIRASYGATPYSTASSRSPVGPSPASCGAKQPVGRSGRFTGVFPRLASDIHTEHVGPPGMLFGTMAQALDERPKLFPTPEWVKQKGQPRKCPRVSQIQRRRSSRSESTELLRGSAFWRPEPAASDHPKALRGMKCARRRAFPAILSWPRPRVPAQEALEHQR